jgi:hypothetical protein
MVFSHSQAVVYSRSSRGCNHWKTRHIISLFIQSPLKLADLKTGKYIYKNRSMPNNLQSIHQKRYSSVTKLWWARAGLFTNHPAHPFAFNTMAKFAGFNFLWY